MNATCSDGGLRAAVALAAKAAAKGSSLPILGCVRLEATPDGVAVDGQDLETCHVRVLINAEVAETGAAVVNASVLSEVVGALKGDIILGSADAGGLRVVADDAQYVICGQPVDEWPQPKADNVVLGRAELDGGLLASALDRVLYAVSDDYIRPILQGVSMVIGDGTLTAVATDTYRLAMTYCRVDGDGAATALVPGRALAELRRALRPDELVRIAVSARDVVFDLNNGVVVLRARQIEGEFPKWERMVVDIAAKRVGTVELHRAALADAIRFVRVIARDDAHRVAYHVEDGRIYLRAVSPDLGTAATSMPVVTQQGQAPHGAFNAAYLLQTLAYGADVVEITYASAFDALVIRDVNSLDNVCLLMPMQVV